MRPHVASLLVTAFLVLPALAGAQPEVDAVRVLLGAAGSTCVQHTGTGAPSTSLGSVCDTYWRKDSPYTIYQKTGASTWTAVVRLPGDTGITTVGALDAGSITSNFGAINVGSDGVTGGAFSGTTGAFSTSVTSPLFTNSSALSLTTASGNATIAPAGDIVLNPTGDDILPTTGYDLNIGALTNKFLTLHVAEIWAETLVAQNTIATIGGRILVGPTTTLTSDLASGATSMVVKHNQMSSGDRVVLQVNNQVEWIAVTSGASGSGPYTYNISRNQDGSGANNWTAGDAVFNTGTTGNGYIDLYSVAGLLPGSTAGPTIVGNQRLSGTYSDVAPRWAIGNLNGLYGYGATTYGVALGDSTAANLTIDATNGIRFRNSTTTTLGITGAEINLQNTGVIKSGSASALGTGTGIWLAAGSGTPVFRVGNPSADYLQWNGSNLTVKSVNFTADSSGVRVAPWNVLDTSCPGSCVDLTRGYGWTALGTGVMAIHGLTGSTSGSQEINIRNEPDSSNPARTWMSAGGTVIDMLSAGTIAMTASAYVDTPDFRIYANNSSTSSKPYMRGDGNALIINARSAANGGVLYLNSDSVTPTSIGLGGGDTQLYQTIFQTRPQWPTALAQTTVGAAGGASALPATPVGYVRIIINGANYVVPAYNP